jgi:hypothetical protein
MIDQDQHRIEHAKQLFEELANTLGQLSDAEVGRLFDTGVLDVFLSAILEPSDRNKFPNIAEFLLANKMRSAYIAALQFEITHRYSFPVTKDNETSFASPSHIQWFEDGVMLLDAGRKPFAGILALYRNGKLSYPIAARDTKPGEKLGPEDFEFLNLEDSNSIKSSFYRRKSVNSMNLCES